MNNVLSVSDECNSYLESILEVFSKNDTAKKYDTKISHFIVESGVSAVQYD